VHVQRLGSRYRLEDRLGGGGMGEVFLARADDENGGDGTLLAAKLLRPDLTRDIDVVARFLQESRLLRSVRHPHVVRVLDLVAEGDRLGIVMEYVPGGDLRRAVPFPCPVPLAVDLLGQVAEGLAAIHAAGITHRDLKPENVLVQAMPDGTLRARLTDFGVSYRTDLISAQHDRIIGTVGYLSPEGAHGRRAGPAADVYALGVMLYELTTGRRPFVAESPAAVIRAHAESPVPRPPALPDPVWALLSDLLAKSPQARPDAAEVARRLRALSDAPVPIAFRHTVATVPSQGTAPDEATLVNLPANVGRIIDPDTETALPGTALPGLALPEDSSADPSGGCTPSYRALPPSRETRWTRKPRRTVVVVTGVLALGLLAGVLVTDGVRGRHRAPVDQVIAGPTASSTSATASTPSAPTPTRKATRTTASTPTAASARASIAAASVNTPAYRAPAVPVLAIYQPDEASLEDSNRKARLVISEVRPGTGSVTSVLVEYNGGTQQVNALKNVSGPYYTTVTSLVNGTRYTFTVRVCNSFGRCTVSAPVRFIPYTVPTLGPLRARATAARVAIRWPALGLLGNPRSWTCRLTADSFPYDPAAPHQKAVAVTGGSVTWKPQLTRSYVARETCTDGVKTVTGPALAIPVG
jgi:serine/threonine protein kinase